MTVRDTSTVAEQKWRPGFGPAWFQISRYEEAHLLSAAQWAVLLEIRRSAWTLLQTGRPFENDEDPITPECLAQFYELMDHVWDDPHLVGSPIAPPVTGMKNGFQMASDPEMASLASQFFGRFVRRADVGELVSTLAGLGPISESLLTAWRTGRTGDFYPEDPARERAIWFREVSPRAGRALLSIDLDADCRDAIKQFESLFKELQRRKATHRPEIALFVQHRLLAYLDLLLWMLATGQTATWEDMLIVVFGTDSGGRDVDTFRKFATKQAAEAFKGTLIQRLRGIANLG
jgi:hypothetical protein